MGNWTKRFGYVRIVLSESVMNGRSFFDLSISWWRFSYQGTSSSLVEEGDISLERKVTNKSISRDITIIG